MPDFLSAFPDAYLNVSPGFVETLIQSHREELFTGLMRLRYPSENVFVFTFLEGVQQKLYHYLEKNTEVIARQSWLSSLDRPDASVVFVPASVESMRLIQLAHEAPVGQVDVQTLTPQHLAEQVTSWAKSDKHAILHVRADQFNRIYFMSGISNPVIEAVSFADGVSSFSINDISFPTSFPPLYTYQITRYVSDGEHVTWQDYELRLAFNLFMRLLLNRFSEVAGRMLTDRLCEQISHWLKEEGWNIRVTMNGVANHEFFESIENAIDVYLEIIRCFHDEASPAIGMRMAEGLWHDVLPKLDSYRRETIIRHIYNEERLNTVTGRVWR